MDEGFLLTAACFVFFGCLVLSAGAFVEAVRPVTEPVSLLTDPARLFLPLRCCFLGGEITVKGVDGSSWFVIVLVLLILVAGSRELVRSLLFTVGGAGCVGGANLSASALFSLAVAAKEPVRGLLIVVDGVGGFNGVLLE